MEDSSPITLHVTLEADETAATDALGPPESVDAELDARALEFGQQMVDADQRAIQAATMFLGLFREYCIAKGYDHIIPERTNFTRSVFHAAIYIIDEIMQQPPETRPITYSAANVIEAFRLQLSGFAQGVNVRFFALVKDSLPPDNPLVKKMAFMISQSANFPFILTWMVPEQIAKVSTQLGNPLADVGAQTAAFFEIYEQAEEHPVPSGFTDYSNQVAHALDLLTRMSEAVADDLEEAEEITDFALKDLRHTIKSPKARRKSPGGAVSQLDESYTQKVLSRELSVVVVDKITEHKRNLRELRRRFDAITVMIKGASFQQAVPFLQQAARLVMSMSEQADAIEHYATAAVCFLAEQACVLDVKGAEKFRQDIASDFCEIYSRSVQKTVYQIAIAIAAEKGQDHKISPPEFHNTVKIVIGQLHTLLRKATPLTRRKDLEKLAMKFPKEQYESWLNSAIAECESAMKLTYANVACFGREPIKRVLMGTPEKAYAFHISCHLLTEDAIGWHKEECAKIFAGKPSLSVANLKRNFEVRMEKIAQGFKVLRSIESQPFRDGVMAAQITQKRKMLEATTENSDMIRLLEDALTNAESILANARTFSNGHTHVCSCISTMTSHLCRDQVSRFLDETPGDFETSVEKAQREEREEMARIAYLELMAEEEKKPRKKKAKAPAEPVAVASKTPEREEPSPEPRRSAQSTTPFPAYCPQRAKFLLGKTTLSVARICKTEAQIYYHQALVIAANILRHPEYGKALLPSLLESVHLTLEQQATAHGIVVAQVDMDRFTTHKLAKRMQECALVPLIPRVSKLMTAGTYNSRYPHINALTAQGDTITGALLKDFNENGKISEELLLTLISELNAIMAQIHKMDSPPATTPESLEGFCPPDAPLPLAIDVEIAPLVEVIRKQFVDSKERTNTILLLQELEQLILVIKQNGGIPKELLGIYLHAVYRIEQYVTKNLLTIRYQDVLKEAVSQDTIPVRSRHLAEAIRLDPSLCDLIDQTDMRKGLDYPLGRRNSRPTTEKEQLLLEAHFSSQTPVGFTAKEKTIPDEELVHHINKSAHELVKIIHIIAGE